jgi:hypothetical protein
MTHRIIIALACKPDGTPRYSQRGPLYNACFEGEPILSGSSEPFLEACRILKARGLSGPVELWDETRPFPRMRSTIEAAAWLTVEEGDGRPRFRRWRPNPRARVGGEAVEGEIALPGTHAALDAMAAILSGAAHDQ